MPKQELPNVEIEDRSVYGRYARAARAVEPALCCPVEYDRTRLTEVLVRHPIRNQVQWLELRALEERLRREHPLVGNESVRL